MKPYVCMPRLARAVCLAGALAGFSPALPVFADTLELRVAATVLPRARLTDLHQVPLVRVTPDDVQRGYVEVHSATRFDLTSNSATHFEVWGGAQWLVAVHVLGMPGGALALASNGRARTALPPFRQHFRAELSYRFELAPETAPGVYSWPLSVSLTPI